MPPAYCILGLRIPLPTKYHIKKGDIRRYLLFYGVGNGTRTHNARNHNPVLCQLNYTHHIQFAEVARQEGERPDRRQWREEGGERVAAVSEGRRSKDRGHSLGTATGHDHRSWWKLQTLI